MNKIRLQVALAKAGIASRRKATELIKFNRIKVNGRVITEKGFGVDIAKDKITFDGRPIWFEKKKYYILNKPNGVISTTRDEHARKKVSDYLKVKGARLYPVGRLDKNTTGLIILTNDGVLTYRLTHPKFKVDRVYQVKVKGRVEEKDLARLKTGIVIDGKIAQAEKIVFRKRLSNSTLLLIILREGRKREVRKMFEVVGREVLKLKRIAYGPVRLKGLGEGQVRPLTEKEVTMLKSGVGLTTAD